MKSTKLYIYGKHSVLEAIRYAPGAVQKVYLSTSLKDPDIRSAVFRAGIPVAEFKGDRAPGVDSSATHQGVIGVVSTASLMKRYDDFFTTLSPTPDTSLVLLGEVQDPHNVGAVIRSAAAFGASAVLVPEHNQAQVTGAVVKVSAGMAFRIPLVSIGNVNHTVRDLKKRGFWIYGLSSGSDARPLPAEKFDAPAVFVLGNEGSGIREKTLEVCDIVLKIPIHSQCESLNAAASAAVALYAWSAQHPKVL